MSLLPEHILKLIDPRDRPKGPAGMLAGEAVAAASTKLEREEQKVFRLWLLLRRDERVLSFDWSRTDKATTREIGRLDFVIFGPHGHSLFIEFKAAGGKLSTEQQAEADLLIELGHLVYVAQTAQSAIEVTRAWLREGFAS